MPTSTSARPGDALPDLAPARGPDVASLVARLRAAGCVFAEDEARLLIETATGPAELDTMVRRRVAGLPLEHVLGWVEFGGLRLAVDPWVFVPRRRTELLVDQAVALSPRAPVVVDLACGCGALGVVVATRTGAAAVHAVDVDPAAVACARRNLAPLGGHAHVGDLYTPLPAAVRGRVDVLLANVPYVPTAAVALMPREAREHEPRIALDGGPDGLDLLRRVAAGARHWLRPGGLLLTEVGEDQVTAATAAMGRAGMTPTVVTDPDLGATVLIGRA